MNKSIRPDLKHELFECGRCGLFYQRPMDLDLLLSFYPESYYEKAHGRLFRWIDSVRNAFRAHAVGWRARKGKVIDIGCGAGTLLRALKERGWTAVGMDWNPANAARVAKAVGCEVAAGPDSLDTIPEKSMQAVAMMHVLEHEQEPGQLLSVARRILEPGGRIVVAVPNGASLTRALFGQYWAGYDLPRHRRIFTPRSLQACLERSGFQVERTTGRFSDEWLDLLRSAYLFSRERGLGGRIVPPLLTGALFLPITAASLFGYGSVMFMFAKRR
jgi:SAM-dependent methyltransferase